MTDPAARRAGRLPAVVAWSSLAVAVGLVTVSLLMSTRRPPGLPGLDLDTVLFAARFLCLAAVGAPIVARRPWHPIGRLLLGTGLLVGAVGVCAEVARRLYVTHPYVGAVLYLIGDQLAKVILLLLGLMLLVFPTGRLASPRARWLVAALLVVVGLAALSGLTASGPVPDPVVGAPPTNPLGVASGGVVPGAAGPVGLAVFGLLLVAAAATVVGRFRRGDAELRVQVKWFALAVVALAVTTVGDGVSGLLTGSGRPWPTVPFVVGYVVATVGMAAAIAIAILRHQLFDIDVVLSRTLAYGALASLITAGYIGVVAGVGSLLAAGPAYQALLAVVVTAAVAAVFLPVKTRLERAADRLVFGQRAGPDEVLAEFTARLDGIDDPAELLPVMTRLVADGTASDVATLHLHDDDGGVTWPVDGRIEAGEATRSVLISHAGTTLGRMSVLRRSGRRLNPTEERLMDGLALQAGLVLRNAGLQRELGERLDELRASRARLVAAQDQERRRLERDLHDGAQQILISLRMKLGLTRTVADHRPEDLEPLVQEMQDEIGEALDSLRSLARGIHPPLLESGGLHAALSAQARQTNLPVDVDCGPERYPRELEGAVYFCCSEALQNVVKHSGATRGSVRVWTESGWLRFEVGDDGCGFVPDDTRPGSGLQNMRDRLDVLDGRIVVDSSPGAGTVVRGRLPV